MNKFFGLVIQEHRYYTMSNVVMAGLVGIFIFLGPLAIIQIFPNTGHYDVNNIRMIFTMIAGSLVWIFSIAMFSSSLNRDIKTKELWLHNSQSIYSLIGAKVIYHCISMIALGIVAFTGFFFVGDLIVGTLMQYLVFGIACFILVFAFYLFFIVVILFVTALNNQLARYIGKLSYVVMLITVMLILEIINRLPNFTLVQFGKVESSFFNQYLPTFSDRSMNVNLYFDFYIVEEIVMTMVLILLYVVSCKWIERVSTR
ncbi:hypothetical protein UACE39S_05497 [Ureibacillus acetophenoni]